MSGLPPPPKLHPLLPLAAIVLLAFVLRGLYLFEMRGDPVFETPQIDSEAYDSRGWEIAQGDWAGEPRPFYQDPFYPYFLGVIYRVFGHERSVVRWIQIILGSLHVLLIFGIARRVADRPTGLLAAGLTATYKLHLFYEGHVEKTALSCLGVDATLLALIVAAPLLGRAEARVPWRWAVAGLILGLTALTRGNVLLFAPFAAVWTLVVAGRGAHPDDAPPEPARASGAAAATEEPKPETEPSPAPEPKPEPGPDPAADPAPTTPATGPEPTPDPAPPAERTFSWKAGLAAAACLTVGTIVPILPVTIRNVVVGGELVLTTAQAGQNFYIGWSPANRTGTYVAPHFIRQHPFLEGGDWHRHAEAELGRELGSGEASSHYLGKGLDAIAADPGRAAGLFWLKLRRIFNAEEIADNYSVADFERSSILLRLPLPSFAWIGPLGLLGLGLVLLDARARRRASLLILFIPVYALSLAAFYVFARYRMPLVGPLTVLAAWAVISLGRDVAADRYRRVAIAFPILLALSLAVVLPPRGLAGAIGDDASLRGAYRALALMRRGEPEAALGEADAALARDPANPWALLAKGDALLELGRPDLAVAQWQAALVGQPDFPYAHQRIAGLKGPVIDKSRAVLAYRQRIADDPNDVAARFELAALFAKEGLHERALPLIEAVLEAHPGNDRALNLHGLVLMRRRHYPEAERRFVAAIAANPVEPQPRINLIHVRRTALDIEGALAACNEALAAEIGKVPALRVQFLVELAQTLEAAQRPDEAVDAARAALEIAPENGFAQLILGLTLLRSGAAAEAVVELEKVVEAQPDYPPARSFLIQARRAAGLPPPPPAGRPR